MKIIHFKNKVKLIAVVLVLLFIFINVNLVYSGDCEHGLGKCMTHAIAVTIANPAAGLAWAGYCSIGYQWCRKFY